MWRQTAQISVLKEYRGDIIISIIIIIIVVIVVIESAFIYHLCFVVLSILHHRDNGRRIERGEKNKK